MLLTHCMLPVLGQSPSDERSIAAAQQLVLPYSPLNRVNDVPDRLKRTNSPRVEHQFSSKLEIFFRLVGLKHAQFVLHW